MVTLSAWSFPKRLCWPQKPLEALEVVCVRSLMGDPRTKIVCCRLILDGVLFATTFGTCTLSPSSILWHTELLPTLFEFYYFGPIGSADSIAVCAIFGTLGIAKARRIHSTNLATGYAKLARAHFTIR